MPGTKLIGRTRWTVALALALIVGLGFVATADAARPGKTAQPTAVVGQTVAPNVVNSKTIYDDGDGTSDIYYNAPPTIGSGFQDFWYLVRGDIVSSTPPPPFNIETISYFLRDNWNTINGEAAVWAGSNLVTPAFLGDDNSITIGFNNVTLTTPLTIPAAGVGVFWLGAINTYFVGSTATECTSCRVVGIDNVGSNMPSNGFFIQAEANNVNITGAAALGSNRVPIIRAGITATSVTLPVELLEFSVN